MPRNWRAGARRLRDMLRRRRESKRRRRDQLDFVALILQLLAFRARSLFLKCRAPSADDSLRLFLAATKTEAAYESWVVVIQSGQSKKGVLRIELLDLLQRLRSRICLRKIAQSHKCGTQKILHRRFAIQLINIAVVPLIEGSIKVRQMC